jgi:hypothetical protein
MPSLIPIVSCVLIILGYFGLAMHYVAEVRSYRSVPVHSEMLQFVWVRLSDPKPEVFSSNLSNPPAESE